MKNMAGVRFDRNDQNLEEKRGKIHWMNFNEKNFWGFEKFFSVFDQYLQINQ